jgi:aspartyl-tRNA(Asn)/glutamyl-tRNA(Gln) amidotransferase subunit A
MTAAPAHGGNVMADELHSKTIAELAPLIQERKLSPVELTTAALDRAESVGSKLSSIITLLRDQALAQAKAREADIARGGYRGPLDGIPVSVKDNLATAGIRTTLGSKLFENSVPGEDAFAIAQLKAAGAIIIAKDNMHELAGGITTNNQWFGRARNPWNLELNPGGSSGGTAANVAGRVSYAGLGTDLGGSVRAPAALCGIYGLKASAGRVSTRGLLGSANVNDYIGPMARSPEDIAIVLQAIAGYDLYDPNSVPVAVPDYQDKLGKPLAGLKVGVPTNFYFDDCVDEVEDNFWAAVKILEGYGVEVTRIELAMLNYAEILRAVSSAESVVQFEPQLREQRENIGDVQVRQRMLAGQFVLARDFIKAGRIQYLLRQEYLASFKRVDFLMAPSRNVPPTPPGAKVTIKGVEHDPSVPGALVIGHNFFPCNSTGLPSLAVPSGFTKYGLPTGMLMIGRPFDEATLLQVANAYERVREGRDAVPADVM